MLEKDAIAQPRFSIREGGQDLTSSANIRDAAFIDSQVFVLAGPVATAAGSQVSTFLHRLPNIPSVAALIKPPQAIS